MTKLSSERITEEKQKRDVAAITDLKLQHRALSDVSCLIDFKNLERLDLGFNNLLTLEGLSPCINLKWLSVVQNKLQNLRGIENLLKLTVLNAGKNKLKSMGEIRSLTSLRALILNDNEISSIGGLDQLKELNALVLSRNPIRDVGVSLTKVKSVTKLSLSSCQLQKIGSSLKSLVDLKELRLTHNEIMTLPAELEHNVKLQNLELGNNLITRFSDLKVIASLHNLRNLNLQGNPVAENDKLANKIKKLVPGLHIFNTRPIERNEKNDKSRKGIDADDISDSLDNVSDMKRHEVKFERLGTSEKNSRRRSNTSECKDGPLDNARKFMEKKAPKKMFLDSNNNIAVKKESNRKKQKVDSGKLDPIDDGETPFVELIASKSVDHIKDGSNDIIQEIAQDIKVSTEKVTFPAKRKKTSKHNRRGRSALELASAVTDVGMGGPSTWDD